MNCYLNIRHFWPLIGICNFLFAQTEVNFKTTSGTISEILGSYQIPLSIVGEDMGYPTTVEVHLTSDNAEDINNYQTQTISFPTNEGSDQNLTITITNDAIVEVNQSLRFELKNISGGNNAVLGDKIVFDLTIIDDEILHPGDVIINEIMYDPMSSPEQEWIELKNTTDATIDLGGFYLTDDGNYPATGEGDFVVPEGIELDAGGYIVFMTNGIPDSNNEISNTLLIDVETGSRTIGMALGNGLDNVEAPSTMRDLSLALKFNTVSNDKLRDVLELTLGASCMDRNDILNGEQTSYPKNELHVGIIQIENVLEAHLLSTLNTKGMKEVFADIIVDHFMSNVSYDNVERLIYEENVIGRTYEFSPLVVLFEESDLAWIYEARDEINRRLVQYNEELGTNYSLSVDSDPENYIPHATVLHRDTMADFQFSDQEKNEFISKYWMCGITTETNELTLRIPDWEFFE